MSASGSLAYAQIATTPGADGGIAVYNAGTTDIPAHTAVIVDTSYIMESTDVTLNMLAVKTATATAGQTAFVTRMVIPAKKTGTCFGVGAIARGIAQSTVTAGTYVGTSGTTSGSLSTASAASGYVGFALATVATTEEFPFLYIPGTSV
jgi:hypothetical protein